MEEGGDMDCMKFTSVAGFLVMLLISVVSVPGVVIATENTGVIVVDVQGDFTTWKNGSLAVNGTDKAFVGNIQKETELLKKKGCLIFGT